jgi:hypothetical protein
MWLPSSCCSWTSQILVTRKKNHGRRRRWYQNCKWDWTWISSVCKLQSLTPCLQRPLFVPKKALDYYYYYYYNYCLSVCLSFFLSFFTKLVSNLY